MAANISLAKKALRKEIKKVLLGMSDEQRRLQSQNVAEKILKHKWFKESNRVSIYLSLKHEVNTIPILEEMLEQQKTCFVPHYDEKVGNRVMKMLQINSMQDYASLPTTKWNIKQPNDDNRLEALETGGLDLIIVPGVAFTKSGQRLGNGGGYYDSYIRRSRQKSHRTYTIALCFNEQIVHEIPLENHDEIIDEVLFPEKNI